MCCIRNKAFNHFNLVVDELLRKLLLHLKVRYFQASFV